MDKIWLDVDKDGFGAKKELTHHEHIEGNSASVKTSFPLAMIKTECRTWWKWSCMARLCLVIGKVVMLH